MSNHITSVLNELYLIEFEENKNNECFLVKSDQLLILNKKFSSLQLDVEDRNRQEFTLWEDINTIFNEEIKYVSIVHIILIIGEGNISLCGMFVPHILCSQGTHLPSLYFHSCTVEQAYIILNLILEFLPGNYKYCRINNSLIINYKGDTVELFLNVYESREHILANIPYKYGWDQYIGYFSSMSAALALILSAIPIHPNYTIKDIYEYSTVGIVTMADKSFTFPQVNFEKEIIFVYDFFGNSIDYQYVSEPTQPSYEDILIEEFQRLYCIKHPKIQYKSLNIKEKFGKEYSSTNIGIEDSRYVAFVQCIQKFYLPKELFYMLCCYWLKAESQDARQRLLNN